MNALALVAALVASGPEPAPLKLKVGDGVRVVVLGFPDYTSEYFVLSDGSISGVGFGRVRAAGRTIAEFESEVAQRLQRFVRQPQVNVVLTQERPSAVFLMIGDGAASPTPGIVPFQNGLELRQVVAQGRLPQPLDQFETRVYRRGVLHRTVDLGRLLGGLPGEWNGPIEPNDVVTVMPAATVRVWVLGLVANPGEKRLRSGSTLAQAVASGGEIRAEGEGFNDLEVTLRRGPEVIARAAGELARAETILLREGDVVTVQPPARLRVTVGGYVAKPGEFALRPEVTLQQVVNSHAGGLAPEGALDRVLIFRGAEVLAADARPSSARIPLHHGDAVFILRNERAFTVLGEVLRPGTFAMDLGRTYRLQDALSMAGGLGPRGSIRRAQVVTLERDRYVSREYHLDKWLKDGQREANPELKPGDTVLFGQPRGITFQGVTQVLSGALLIETLLRR